MGRERVSRGEGIRGRPVVVERQGLTVNRKRPDPAVLNLNVQTRRMMGSREEAGRKAPRGNVGIVVEGS